MKLGHFIFVSFLMICGIFLLAFTFDTTWKTVVIKFIGMFIVWGGIFYFIRLSKRSRNQ